jgi:hypothetical protein
MLLKMFAVSMSNFAINAQKLSKPTLRPRRGNHTFERMLLAPFNGEMVFEHHAD